MSNRRLIELLMINKCFAKLYYYGKYFRKCTAHAYGRLNRHNHLLLLVFIFIFIFLIFFFVLLRVFFFSILALLNILWWFCHCKLLSIQLCDLRWKKIELPQKYGNTMINWSQELYNVRPMAFTHHNQR